MAHMAKKALFRPVAGLVAGPKPGLGRGLAPPTRYPVQRQDVGRRLAQPQGTRQNALSDHQAQDVCRRLAQRHKALCRAPCVAARHRQMSCSGTRCLQAPYSKADEEGSASDLTRCPTKSVNFIKTGQGVAR